MATWNPPSDADLGVGKPAKPSHMKQIRDLSTALAERASGAPWLNARGAVEVIRDFGLWKVLGEVVGFLQGTWVVPEGVTRVEVTAIGGGGAGGGGPDVEVGSGGGAGAVEIAVLEVTPGQVIAVTIGAGGRTDFTHPHLDTSLDSYQQGDGGRTTFGMVVAKGGRGGGAAPILGGEGGQVSGSGVPGARGGPAIVDFAGGYIASGAGAQSYFGSGGESLAMVSGSPVQAAGVRARAPGAGGSGTLNNQNGGRGADGAVVLRY